MEPRASPEADLPSLIRRAKEGERAAFDRLVLLYRDRIFRWALVRTGDAEDAEDATQEALVRLHSGLRKFRGGSRFETWLYAITRSAVAEAGRRERSRRRMTDRYATLAPPGRQDPAEAVLHRMETGRLARRVREFLTELPLRQREAVDLVDLQGLAPAEAAELSGSNPATLRTHLFRGRRALRVRLLSEVADGEAT